MTWWTPPSWLLCGSDRVGSYDYPLTSQKNNDTLNGVAVGITKRLDYGN